MNDITQYISIDEFETKIQFFVPQTNDGYVYQVVAIGNIPETKITSSAINTLEEALVTRHKYYKILKRDMNGGLVQVLRLNNNSKEVLYSDYI
jgi:hypothetical protein